MTPKEKAKELVKRFEDGLTIKDCALIAVYLLMEESYRQHDYEGFISYWKEVKKEIENYG